MMTSSAQLEMIFQLDTLDDASAARMVIGAMEGSGPPPMVQFDSGEISRAQFLEQVERTGRWPSEITSAGMAYRYGVVSAWAHCFVIVRELVPGAAGNWSERAAPFLSLPGFVQAWVSDCDFDYWQNAEEISQYEAAGRGLAGLALVSNSLPPPLEHKVIDISFNPGRRTIRQGYVEAIGERMWLGPQFRIYAGPIADDRLLAAGWTVTAARHGITFLQAEPGSFREGASSSRQTDLRFALYGHP
jgi:hypothetical protein